MDFMNTVLVDQLGGAGVPGVGAASEVRTQQVMAENGMGHAGESSGENVKTFSAMLQNSLEEVNQHQHEADRAIKELVAGRSKNVHETMLAIERADMSLKLMMQVRNKVLDAYREIMRMQV